MNKDLELSILRRDCKHFEQALSRIRQQAHDFYGTTGAHHALKRIEKAAAHALDYRSAQHPKDNHAD